MYRYKRLYEIQHELDEIYADTMFDAVPFSILVLLKVSYCFVGIVAGYLNEKGL